MITSLILATAIGLQSTPTDIEPSKLPKNEHCVVCEANGSDHGVEKVVAGVMYDGKAYYFCNKAEVAEFKKDPEGFKKPVLPRPMPAFELKDTTGKLWNAEAMKGKVILVDFWATWCGPCKQVKPALDKVRKQFVKSNFEILSVSIDEKLSTLEAYLKKNKFDNPVLHDASNTWGKWKVRVVPSFFVLKDGQVVDHWTGVKNEGQIRARIQPFLPKVN